MGRRLEALKVVASYKPRRKHRKQREAPPPSSWCRSKNGTPFLLKKTNQVNEADEWLYRADFGNLVGNDSWSITDLEKNGVVFLDGQPSDWQLADWRSGNNNTTGPTGFDKISSG